MKKNTSNIFGLNLSWDVKQDSEHPEMILFTDQGEIYIQVYVSPRDAKYNELFLKGKSDLPFSVETAKKILESVVLKGYLDSYHDSEIGLVFTETFELIEN